LMIDILSVMLDIIILAVYFPSTSGSTEKFSAVIAIFNLLFRSVQHQSVSKVSDCKTINVPPNQFIKQIRITFLSMPRLLDSEATLFDAPILDANFYEAFLCNAD
jgi:hypothetical protein